MGGISEVLGSMGLASRVGPGLALTGVSRSMWWSGTPKALANSRSSMSSGSVCSEPKLAVELDGSSPLWQEGGAPEE